MKAPDKIYLDPEILANSEVTFIEAIVPEFRAEKNDIEYIRTAVFIEKACEWFEKNLHIYNTAECMGDRKAFIEDFKNAMEGE